MADDDIQASAGAVQVEPTAAQLAFAQNLMARRAAVAGVRADADNFLAMTLGEGDDLRQYVLTDKALAELDTADTTTPTDR